MRQNDAESVAGRSLPTSQGFLRTSGEGHSLPALPASCFLLEWLVERQFKRLLRSPSYLLIKPGSIVASRTDVTWNWSSSPKRPVSGSSFFLHQKGQ